MVLDTRETGQNEDSLLSKMLGRREDHAGGPATHSPSLVFITKSVHGAA